MKKADVADGIGAGVTDDDGKELPEANKRIRLLEQENEVLRRAAAFPLLRELAATGAPIRVPYRVLGLSTQGCYKWARNRICQRDWDDAHPDQRCPGPLR